MKNASYLVLILALTLCLSTQHTTMCAHEGCPHLVVSVDGLHVFLCAVNLAVRIRQIGHKTVGTGAGSVLHGGGKKRVSDGTVRRNG